MIYEFQKGNHRSNRFKIGFTFLNKLEFEAKFHPSCLYDLESVDNYDANKLFGFSADFHHHWNSARIGWRCTNGKDIEVLTYTYVRKKRRNPEILGVVRPGDTFRCKIIKDPHAIHYHFQNENYKNSITEDTHYYTFLFKYLLYPYFGGNMTAPHNMQLDLKRIRY